MKITDVRTVLLTGPCTNDPFFSEARKYRSAAFIEIHTDVGLLGLGETYAGYFCPEVVPGIVDFFQPILVGKRVEDSGDACAWVQSLWDDMYRCGNFWCRTGLGAIVLTGIEAALWDLQGKVRACPAYRLLSDRVPQSLCCYATGGPSNYPLKRLEAKVAHYLSRGFHAVKIGAGYVSGGIFFSGSETPEQTPDFEEKKFAFLRKAFGAEVSLMLDAHMGNSPFGTWSYETAEAVVLALTPHELLFIEEPLPYSNVENYRRLSSTSNIPIAGGECLTTCEWDGYVANDAFDIGQPDASFLGGLLEFRRVSRLLECRGKTVATHAWGAGGSLMQNVHAGFAAANTLILEVPPDFGPLHSEVIGDSFRMKDGQVLPPETPGLGISLTVDLKNKFPFVPGSGEFVSVPGKALSC